MNGARLSRDKIEAIAVERPHNGEMPPVHRRDRGDAEAFRGRYHRSVNRPQGKVAVGMDQLGDSQPVVGGHRFNTEMA